MKFPLLEACLPAYSFVDIDTIMPVCTAVFNTFQPLSCDVLRHVWKHGGHLVYEFFYIFL